MALIRYLLDTNAGIEYIARVHSLSLITRNDSDFKKNPNLEVINLHDIV
jgi:predicted nucleic acid-binding protein